MIIILGWVFVVGVIISVVVTHMWVMFLVESHGTRREVAQLHRDLEQFEREGSM